MADKTCININFDSLAWSLSAEPQDFFDPTFFDIADRFFALADKHGFRYTIFVIGKDLENPRVAERVKRWHEQGHEIGNHSYSHKQNLGSLSRNELEADVMKSHEIITRVCGKEPRGFIAPNWSTSVDLVDVLIKNNYLYDTSVFPSYFMWLVLAKLRWNFRNDYRRQTVFQRRDILANIFASRRPYFVRSGSLIKKGSGGLLMIPLPATPLLRIPCWHTMSFLLHKNIFNYVLRSCLSEKYFYYLMHPTDLYDRRDIPAAYRDIKNLERLDVPLGDKMALLDNSLDIIMKRSSKIVTLEQIAKELISKRVSI